MKIVFGKILLSLLVVALLGLPVEVSALEVRVGFYNNPPQIFADEAGEPQGLYPDLLRATASAEGWSLTYVPGTFTEGLERLRRGEIDLMTAIAFREERTEFADFSRQSVLFLWAELLARPEANISNLIDVHGRRVAVTRSGNNFAVFKELCHQFGVQPEFLQFDSFAEVFQAVADGRADAGIASKLFAAREHERYGLAHTGVIFNPFTLHFAAPKWLGNGLLDLLDQHLDAWQKDSGSVYYQSLERWLNVRSPEPERRLPNWLLPLGLSLTVCLLLTVAWLVTLRRQVRQATAEIAEREQLALIQKNALQQIIDSMPIGIWLSDADGHLQLENPAGQKIWGRKGLPGVAHYGEIRGWWADSGQPLAKDDWGLVRALRDGQACLEERIEIEAVDGQRKIVLASAVPLFDEQGRLTGGLEIEQDITEHRRTEQAIGDLARTWQETFDAVSDAIVILDRENQVVQCNRAFETLTGEPCATIVGHVCCQKVRDETGQVVECPLALLSENGASAKRVFQFGSRWLEVSTDPLFDADGEPFGSIHIHSDVTAHKEFETLLFDERLALEMVATGAPVVAVLDRIACNIEAHVPGTYCSVLLVDDDGTHLRHGVAPSLPEGYGQLINGLAIGPQVGSSGTAAYRREPVIVTDVSANPLWADFRDLARQYDVQASWSVPVLNGAEEPMAVVTIYCSASRPPLPEELELVQRGVHLVRVALEKHKKGQERQTLITLLEERNVELEQFTYTVSHDLKTPLVTIGGFVGQLREDLKSGNEDCVAIDLDFIEDSVKTMSSLLANLLNLARSGRTISEPQLLDLRQIVQLSLDFVRGDLGDIPVQRDFPAELPLVHGDPVRLREAVQNLLENAAKFCREAERPEIHVGCRVEGEQALCWVSDNGIGIAPQYHSKIFNLFEKLDSNREGTGIGLAVSRRIIEKHGGRLWVESEGSGKGSTFFMTFPAGQVDYCPSHK